MNFFGGVYVLLLAEYILFHRFNYENHRLIIIYCDETVAFLWCETNLPIKICKNEHRYQYGCLCVWATRFIFSTP